MTEDSPPSRLAADVEYSGRAGGHDYLVRARHRLLETTFTVVIDDVEHDPKAEEKAESARDLEKSGGAASAENSGFVENAE
ncbi:MAG: hypothetical protein L0H39_12380, partial [Brachybacterium sp.]|nr:hypothetical protein [Brachybacterium sp.]